MRIILKELNNKSRKGLYIYVKDDKNKGAYFRFKDDSIYIKNVVDYYTDTRQKKVKLPAFTSFHTSMKSAVGTKRDTKAIYKGSMPSRQAKLRAARIVREYPIAKAISDGYAEGEVINPQLGSQANINKAYKQMLKPLVLDDRISDILIQPDNTKKLAMYMEHIIEVQDDKGQTIYTGTAMMKTTDEVVRTIRENDPMGEHVDEHSPGRFWKRLREKGYTMTTPIIEAYIRRIVLKLRFRK